MGVINNYFQVYATTRIGEAYRAWIVMEQSEKKAPAYNATLLERIDITPQLAIFKVKPDSEHFIFEAGQFTVLGLTWSSPRVPGSDPDTYPEEKAQRLIRRAYSISSGSQEQFAIEFYISLINSGTLTPRIFQLKKGDRLFIGDKGKGVFTLDKAAAGKQIILVATGTGLAPYMSMIRSLSLGDGCPVHPITILHGARYSWDLGYRAELESLSRHCSQLNYLPIITRPQSDQDWTGRSGRLDQWILHPDLSKRSQQPITPENSEFFLCGNPEMVVNCAALLSQAGFSEGSRQEPGNLHMEKYW
ncbi:MAG: ferredoxin--NADP reductase [Magnetococcales bacterium]|nr:ferredoxin--NADP reductase [Magnetococcales bacterium]